MGLLDNLFKRSSSSLGGGLGSQLSQDEYQQQHHLNLIKQSQAQFGTTLLTLGFIVTESTIGYTTSHTISWG